MEAKYLLSALASFVSFNISGLWLGYAGLNNLLKSEGQFLELCSADDSECAARTERFNLIYTAGSTALYCSYVFHGTLLDKYASNLLPTIL